MLSKTLNRLHSLFSPTGGGVRHRKHSTRRDPAIVEAQALEPRCLLTDQLDFINIEQTGGPWSMETIAIGDQLVYVDYDEQYGHELRIFDPATEESSLFVDVNPGPADSLPRDFLIANNKFFFVATDREVGLELRWVDLDDVSREVHTVDLTPGLRSSQPNTLMQINDRVFFFANLPEVDSAYTLRWLNTDDPS